MFSVFFGLTLQGLVSVVLDYYSHPFDTGTELNHESSVDFPAITLCNLNRINCVNLMTERIDLRNTVRDRARKKELKRAFLLTVCTQYFE